MMSRADPIEGQADKQTDICGYYNIDIYEFCFEIIFYLLIILKMIYKQSQSEFIIKGIIG